MIYCIRWTNRFIGGPTSPDFIAMCENFGQAFFNNVIIALAFANFFVHNGSIKSKDDQQKSEIFDDRINREWKPSLLAMLEFAIGHLEKL